MTTNSETDTPRTDALLTHNHDGDFVLAVEQLADFARQLERELNAEKSAHAISFAGWQKALLERDAETEAKLRVIGQCADLLQERDALKAELQTARDGMMTQAREIERAWKECEELRKDKATLTSDMAILIRRLCRAISKHESYNTIRIQALDYLKRKGFDGSPLKSQIAMKGKE